MSIEVIETTEIIDLLRTLKTNKLMARISFFCCFEKINFGWNYGMMKFQLEFCHPSELRLWRTEMLFLTKSKGHKSNVPCQ
jgi:hypothetical protein